jgi:hypothetical protein
VFFCENEKWSLLKLYISKSIITVHCQITGVYMHISMEVEIEKRLKLKLLSSLRYAQREKKTLLCSVFSRGFKNV